MEIPGCPVARIPLSALLAGSDGRDEPIRSVSAQLQELVEGGTAFDPLPAGLHSGFSVWVCSHSLCIPQGSHKAVGRGGLLIHWLFTLVGLGIL